MFSSLGRLFLSSLFFILVSPVLAAAPSTTYQIVNSTVGQNGWYTTGVDTIFTSSASGTTISKLNYYYDSPPAIPVAFTGLNISESSETVYSGNGSHRLYYWAEDSLGNKEATKSFSFKIDTIAPSPWTNWLSTRIFNDHTYLFVSDVSDNVSGINYGSAKFQYRVDGDEGWGYYPGYLSCSGTFATNQWASGIYLFGQVVTPPIDFCNSDWGTCNKSIKLRISDNAGNQSTTQFCLNSPWVKTTKGDIYARDGFTVSPPAAGSNSGDYIVSAGTGGTSAFSSAQEWYLNNYDAYSSLPTYSGLFSSTGDQAVSLPSGKLPTISGSYLVDGDFAIDNTTIPNDLASTQNLGAIIFVNGNLSVNRDFSLHATSGIVFVVSGNIYVNATLASIAGFYITDGTINLAGQEEDDESSRDITITGSLVAGNGFHFNRDLPGNQNQTKPAVIVNFSPVYVLNPEISSRLVGSSTYNWQEVAP